VTDGNSHSQLDTSLSGAREQYAKDFLELRDQTARRLRELRIPLLGISTHEDPLKQLLTVLPPR
jgi:uncharacterized protein (DUF58 family)